MSLPLRSYPDGDIDVEDPTAGRADSTLEMATTKKP